MDSAGDLLAELEAADGVHLVENPTGRVRAAYRRAIHAAISSGSVPDGYRLTHSGRDRGDLVIRLVPFAERPPYQRRPRIAIPSAADPDHPLVSALTKQADHMPISPSLVPRALAIIQALAEDCDRRGYWLDVATDRELGLRMTAQGHLFDLDLYEEQDEIERVAVEEVAATKYAWQRVRPQVVTLPSGRLALRLRDEWHRRTWADRSRWRLDDKLPAVLAEMERRAAEAEQRRLAGAQAAVERHRRWTNAMAQARHGFIDELNRERLRWQVGEWQLAAAMRAYCDAIDQAAVGADSATQALVLKQWLEWCRAEADRIDPLRHVDQLALERPPQVSLADLRRFLPADLSPYEEPHLPDAEDAP